ncbi:MAG: MCE family protein [Candidatus Paracaedimonas acanthamoebae]|uniref:MCE family protein n=1 Tax=Candidatus Paracaedimonas acanthamoebae TaxID=244581 RepID=A0A8J7PK83_9PROT|nr:MCE family protein [Candidatus Paracaedimonas acanthamoebae]
METQAHYIKVGSFVLAMLTALVVFVLWMSKLDFGNKFQIYDIYFEGSVTGLRINEEVRYHGIPIGNVKQIKVDKRDIHRVRVQVTIKDPTLIRENTIASIEAQGLTGYTYIQIQGGTETSPLLEVKEGQHYPVIPSQPSRIEMIFNNMPMILANISHLSENLNAVLSPDNRAHVQGILENIHKISSGLSQGRASLSTTLQEFQETFRDIRGLITRNQGAIEGFTTSGLSDFTHLLAETREMVNSIKQIADGFNESAGAFLHRSPQKGYKIE